MTAGSGGGLARGNTWIFRPVVVDKQALELRHAACQRMRRRESRAVGDNINKLDRPRLHLHRRCHSREELRGGLRWTLADACEHATRRRHRRCRGNTIGSKQRACPATPRVAHAPPQAQELSLTHLRFHRPAHRARSERVWRVCCQSCQAMQALLARSALARHDQQRTYQ